MYLIVLTAVAGVLFIILCGVYFIQNRNKQGKVEQNSRPQRLEVRGDEISRRAQIIRSQRNRLRSNIFNNTSQDRNHEVHDNNINETVCESKDQKSNEKIGAKKAKLEAKEEKRKQREAELRQREDKKLHELKLEKERQIEIKKQIEEECKKREAERLEQEEILRKQHEAYLKLKESFNIEEEGFDESNDPEENILTSFVNYIKSNKVVLLENLAHEFKIKTQQVIDRIKEMQTHGNLTGVIDDRGKFIYVSEEELYNIAKFIKQRGRVTISELAESSNILIKLGSTSKN